MKAIEFVKKNGIEKSKIHLDRMKSAISSETFLMPKGLSREEKRRLILEAGKKPSPQWSNANDKNPMPTRISCFRV